MNNLICFGINHKTANIALREKCAFNSKQLKTTLLTFKNNSNILGSVILSTCNRMEIYVHALNNYRQTALYIQNIISERFSLNQAIIAQHFYLKTDTEALANLLGTTSGLDSQVIGETQIAGQVKNAWKQSLELNTSSSFLNTIFAYALKMNKKTRNNFNLGTGNISIGSVSIALLENKLTSLNFKKIIIIGTGKMGSLLAKYLSDKHTQPIFVANKTFARAAQLAADCHGEAIHFDRLKENLNGVDIIISATTSPHLIIKKELLAKITPTKQKPLFLLDLGLPRDIDPAFKKSAYIHLYDLDDLKQESNKNYTLRIDAAEQAIEFTNKQATLFYQNLKTSCNKQLKLELALAH